MAFADLQVLPERLTSDEVEVPERDANLSDRVVSAESVVVENLKVEGPRQQFVVGKS